MTIKSGTCPYCGGAYRVDAGGCTTRCGLALAVAALVRDAARAGVTELDELAGIAIGMASGYDVGAELARIYRGRPVLARLIARGPSPELRPIAGRPPAVSDRWALFDVDGAPYDEVFNYRALLIHTDDARDI
jgi:hypothetical protein